jgi:hypothetical protein
MLQAPLPSEHMPVEPLHVAVFGAQSAFVVQERLWHLLFTQFITHSDSPFMFWQVVPVGHV